MGPLAGYRRRLKIEYRFKGQDGKYRWFLGQARPRRDEAGRIIAWFGTRTDIQDQKAAHQALTQREEEFATLADNMVQLAWMTRPDGQYRWFLTRAEPIRNEEGELLRWLGTNTDVTAMRELQQQLETAYSDLEAKVMFRNLDLEREVKQLREAAGK